MTRKIGPLAAALLVSALVLAGCAAESPFPTDTPSADSTATGSEPSAPVEPEATPDAEPQPEAGPLTQEETCDWASPRLASGKAVAANGQAGNLESALIGSWQHTHINDGSGYEALETTTDIRYVFPSITRMLFCQDVAGATNQAENAADMTLEGTNIVLPSAGVSYGVEKWDANTMVWKNHRDGSLYLLKRR